jgi:proliferating cell nuclear antigen
MLKMIISLKNLKEVTDLLNTVVTEAKFKVTPEGLSVKAVDPAHVAMVCIDIPKGAFVEYAPDGDEEIAIDVERMKSVIKLASSSDLVTVSRDGGKLKFEINTIVKSISLLDNSSVTTPRVPQVSSENYVVMSKGDLERGLKAAEDVSDSIRLTLSGSEFRAKSSSDSEESEMILSKDMLKEIKCAQAIKSSYPLEYLLKLVKSLSSADEIKLSFKDDYPLTIDFNFGQGTESVKGNFLLAPRMEQ